MSLYLKIGAAIAALAVVTALYAGIRRDAAQDVLRSIERQNNEAANRAEKRALDYDACRDAGRVWDFRSGKCGGS